MSTSTPSFLRALFLLAAAAFLPSEFFCVRTALETQGEVMQSLFSPGISHSYSSQTGWFYHPD
jgi:hypothetical protein